MRLALASEARRRRRVRVGWLARAAPSASGTPEEGDLAPRSIDADQHAHAHAPHGSLGRGSNISLLLCVPDGRRRRAGARTPSIDLSRTSYGHPGSIQQAIRVAAVTYRGRRRRGSRSQGVCREAV